MSMFADYLQERTEDRIIESGQGFVTYRFVDKDTVYIMDIYVKPEFRKQRVASDFSDKVMEIAKKRGCKKMIGSIVPSNKGSTTSLRVLLAHGMRLDSSTNDLIIFSKEII